MQIVKVRKSRRCIDGTVLREYTLNERVPGSMISYLENFGSVKVLADMVQPFYTFRMGNYFNIKGMVDDTAIFVRYQPDFMPHTEEFFTRLVTAFNPDAPDLKTIRDLQDDFLGKIESASPEFLEEFRIENHE